MRAAALRQLFRLMVERGVAIQLEQLGLGLLNLLCTARMLLEVLQRMLEHLLVHMLTVGKWILGPSRRRTTPYGTSAKDTATHCGAISSKN